jgi:hypothetical protein
VKSPLTSLGSFSTFQLFMPDSVIRVNHLGQRYRIRHHQQGGMRYKALREVLADKTKSVGKRLWSMVRKPDFCYQPERLT